MELNLRFSDQLGQHLKSLRKLRGLSQTELGQLIGVGQVRVAAIEARPGSITVDQLLRVFQALNADVVVRANPGPIAMFRTPRVSRASDGILERLAQHLGTTPERLRAVVGADTAKPKASAPTPARTTAEAPATASTSRVRQNKGSW